MTYDTSELVKLRNKLGNARRWNRPEEEAELRRELALCLIEREIRERLSGVRLTSDEFARVMRSLMPYVDMTEREPETGTAA